MGSVNITQGTGTPIRTMSNAGVDGGAWQQVVMLADSDGDFIHAKAIPSGFEDALMVRSMPSQVNRTGFSMTTASGAIDSDWGTLVRAGSGHGIQQTGGNLVLTTGTTANAETIIRSKSSFSGAVRFRCRNTISQRIANQQFILELVDILGDALAITINSATSVTVTFPTNPFTTLNIGQYMYLGAYSGSGTFIPGRYAIASISGNTVTYTVAGFAAGSGTCSVFGWNYNHIVYDGTGPTNTKWDTQRKGWNTGDSVVVINTTVSPGHVAIVTQNDMQASIMDAVVQSNTAVQYTTRGTRIENVPDDVTLAFQIRVVNGSTAPASTTVWTIGQVAVTNWSPQDVTIQDVRPQAPMSALPVQVANTPAVTVNSGTVTTRPDGGGLSVYSFESVAAIIATLIKASAGSLYELTVSNITSAAMYVKLYNKSSAAPVAASDTPLCTFTIAAGATQCIEFGANGKRFTTGIGIGVTGAASKTDTTALNAGAQISLSYV